MEFRYEIDENNEVEIFVVGEEIPFVRQPDQPDGTPWKNRKEAEKWAQNLIAETAKNYPKPDPTTVIIQADEVSADPVK